MKSYTDLEQSKKLAEILPIESADMHYSRVKDEECDWILLLSPIPKLCAEYIENIPCWSLTALLELIPDKISIDNESYYLFFTKKGVEFRGPITWDGQKSKSFETDNILDAAFEMVVWLKENDEDMKILLETKDRNEVIKWMISVLTDSYEYYTSLFKCSNKEMRDFLNDHIKETLCDQCVHLGGGFVENIGKILCNYIFCFKEGTYKIIYDGGFNEDYFVDVWYDWSLWDEYDKCLKEACSIFY